MGYAQVQILPDRPRLVGDDKAVPLTGEAKRAYQREWLRRRREEWIAQNGPCARCGSTEQLDVDHIDAKTKVIKPSSIWGLSAPKRLAELSKCQVLCRACHIEKSKSEHAIGEANGSAKLCEDDVVAIRARHATGESMRSLAHTFSVSPKSIFQIIHRLNWRHVP